MSNAAPAVAAVGYPDVLIPVNDDRWTACLAALVPQWPPALANLAGPRYVGAVQLVSTVLKFVPLLLVGGLFFFGPDTPGPFHAGGGSAIGAVSASAAVLLFSYLGVESAAVSAGEVEDPRRTVGRATVIGTADAALVHLLGTLSVFGTVAHDRLVDSGAPFPDAVHAMFGGARGGWAVAPAALVSMTGCLNGWTLLSAQTPYAAAKDGPFPAAFARRRRGAPTVGVGVTVVLASLLTVYNYASGSAKVFEVLVLVTPFAATVPYLLATAAQIFRLLSGHRDRVDRARPARDAVIASVAAAFSPWLVAGAGHAAVCRGVLFLLAGVLVHAVMAARRQRPKAPAGG